MSLFPNSKITALSFYKLLLAGLFCVQPTFATRKTPVPPNASGILEVEDGAVLDFFVGKRDGGDHNNKAAIPNDSELLRIAQREYDGGSTYLAFRSGRTKYLCYRAYFKNNGVFLRSGSINISLCTNQILELGILRRH